LLRLLLSHVREPGASKSRGTLSSPSLSSGFPRGVSRSDRVRPVEERTTNRKRFVLTHADLSMRHILLDEDGTTIRAILGWDGARAAPRSLGNEALPRWLVRDFDPFVWRWRPAADFWRVGHIPPEGNRFEDPPWTLAELRKYYARVVQELKRKRKRRREEGVQGGTGALERRDAASDTADRNGEDDSVDITKQSLLTLTLDAAIRDPRRRTAALRRVMEKCSRSFEELDFDFFVDTLGGGYEIDSMKLECLANNLRELVNEGFVKGAVVW
jgi:hypothetical protein